MPLLEETGYIPKRKYSSGHELREHADRIVAKWNLNRIAWLSNRVTSLAWDDDAQEWATTLIPQTAGGGEEDPLTVRSRVAILATGLLFVPHIPRIPGIESFKGACFHPARWDYKVTGGTEQTPDLVQLRDKRVGIIGTGATAIQVVPHLAAWSKELYVFQRTPSAVDRRNNADTDRDWARTAFSVPGWQRERQRNFHSFVTNDPAKPVGHDMVGDGWTRMPSYSAMTGTVGLDCSTAEAAQRHLEELHVMDFPRQESIRKRVDELVTNPDVAAKLKPWYPGWCKRPCFHDEYLQVFNHPHVKLVDTSETQITAVTEDGVVVGDEEFKVDVLIVSTGYRSLFSPSPPGRVSIEVTGRDGLSFDKKWQQGVTTLHGMMSHGFPNLFWPGLVQAGGSPNFTACVDMFSEHVASVVSHAARTRSSGNDSEANKHSLSFTVEPSVEAEEEWSQLVASQAGAFACIPGCTPNYYNNYGTVGVGLSPEEQKRLARASLWVGGPEDFGRVLADWRDAGYKGLEIGPVN
jgi:cation diffusion facilitator CzcD-associated flavoprotein CzcO